MDRLPPLNSSNIEPQTGPSVAAAGDGRPVSGSDAASVATGSHFYVVATQLVSLPGELATQPASLLGVSSPDESLPNASDSRTDAVPAAASATDSAATVRCADRKDVASSVGAITAGLNPAAQKMSDDCEAAAPANVAPPSTATASSHLVARVQLEALAGEIGCTASSCHGLGYESSAGCGDCAIERIQSDSVLGETVGASYRVDPDPNAVARAAVATVAAAAVAAASGDDLMPNEGFDTDDSETAGVYDVSHDNANPDVAAADGGANHVRKRLRRGFVRRRPSEGSSSGSSSSTGESDVENGHQADDIRDVNHNSDDSDDGSASRGGGGEERRRNLSSSSSGSRNSDGVLRNAGEYSSDVDSDSDSDSDSSSDSDDDTSSTAKRLATAETEIAPQPLPTCQFVRQLNCREQGALHGHVPTAFTHRLMGSINLAQRLQLYGTLDYHSGCVNTATFNSKGTLLTSGSDDLEVVVWDWARRQALLHFESGHHNNVFQSKFMVHSDDTQIVTSARDGQVRLAELSTTGVCRSTRQLAQHRGAAHKLAVEPDAGHTLLSAGEDGVTFQIDLREEKPTKLLCTKENGQKVPLYSIDKNPCNAHEFIVSGRDQFIRTYDKRKLTGGDDGAVPVKKFCPHALVDAGVREKANVTCCVYNYDGSEVLGTYNDDDIYLFNNEHSDGAEHIHVFKGHRNSATVKGVNFYGPRSEFVVSGSDCGNIFLWDKKTEQIVQFMHGDEGGVVNVLEPHPTFPVLATSGLDHDIKLWTPTADEPTGLQGLAKVIKKNGKERKKDRQRQPQVIDGHMLWMIMQHIQRSARRAGRNPEGTAGGEPGDDDPSDSDSESSDDESELPFRAPSCTTS